MVRRLATSATVWMLTPTPVTELTQPFTWQFIIFIVYIRLSFYLINCGGTIYHKDPALRKINNFWPISNHLANVYAGFLYGPLNDEAFYYRQQPSLRTISIL